MTTLENPKKNYHDLAKQIVIATQSPLFTDEEALFMAMQQLNQNTIPNELAQAIDDLDYELFKQLSPSYLKKLESIPDMPNCFSQKILLYELSGSDLKRAQDLMFFGVDTFRADKIDYFFSGVSSGYDVDSYTDIAMLGGGVLLTSVIVMGGVMVFPATFTATNLALVAIVAGHVLVSAGVIKAGIDAAKYYQSSSEPESKKLMYNLGQDVSLVVDGVALMLPFSKIKNVPAPIMLNEFGQPALTPATIHRNHNQVFELNHGQFLQVGRQNSDLIPPNGTKTPVSR